MRQFFYKLFDAGNATTNPLTSGKIDVRQVYSLSVVMSSSSGSNAGTLKIQVSNAVTGMGNVAMDFDPPTESWVDLPTAQQDGSGTVASGATVVLSVKQLNYAWLRIVWTPSGGAGTITATANGQGF